MPRHPHTLTKRQARRLWLHAQRLDAPAPFGAGPQATHRAVAHLGYVQIDTINVIERCHHHILFTRIPTYERAHLQQAQSADKSVFEYWTHALAYVPADDLPFFLPAMTQHRQAPGRWFASVKPEELSKVLALIKREGPLSIRDIDDDVLVEKDHPWASRKPSKRALQLAFYRGQVTVSARAGMLKSYDLMERHFGWDKRPKAATAAQIASYKLDRALRAQGLVSLDSICYLDARSKMAVRALIETAVRRGQLVPVQIDDLARVAHWVRPDALEQASMACRDEADENFVHILSPFDPLIIQRKRLQALFDYEHRFEAYVPLDKRMFGYFALPVLIGDTIVAALDLKTARSQRQLRIQKWSWIGPGTALRHKPMIEAALERFEHFQLA